MKAFGNGMILGVLVSVLLLTDAPARGDDATGFGVLGDSYSDEYRFYPPDRSTARNWVEMLAELRGLNFGGFDTSGRGEPRNQGYAYNWARSDAETGDLIATGQHTGLAAQVARGEVHVVFIFIGGNDFIHALQSSDPKAALERVGPLALRNYRTAFETIVAAHPEVKLVLATVPDIRELPEFAAPIREGRLPVTLADAYTTAIREFNAQVRSLARTRPRVALIDLEMMTRLACRRNDDHVSLFGRKLDRRTPANSIDHVFLADSRHVGTIEQGVMAQAFVLAVNHAFQLGIAPLSDREIISYARTLSAPDTTSIAEASGLVRRPAGPSR